MMRRTIAVLSGVLFLALLITATPVGWAPIAGLTEPNMFYVYGGPGSLEGRFETAEGEPDPQGWGGIVCEPVPVYWHVSGFNAANLNSHGPWNLAMWAGQSALQQPQWLTPPGYGNEWSAKLQWASKVQNPNEPAMVGLSFYYNYDVEPGYDFFSIEWDSAGSWVSLETITGTNKLPDGTFEEPGAIFDQEWEIAAGGYGGSGGDELRLRLRVITDGGWSDEDGLFDSDGAVQVDDIVVTFNGQPIDGGGDPDGVATFQAGDSEAWFTPTEPCQLQKWAHLIPALLEDQDPYEDNLTPQLAFLVEEEDPDELFPKVRFISPEIDWVSSPSHRPDGVLLRFRTYSTGRNRWYVRYWWMVRSFVDGAWTQWTNDNNTEEQTYGRFRVDQYNISDWVDPNATKIQVALNGADFRPASGNWGDVVMTFDDVSVARYYRGIVRPAGVAMKFGSVHPNPANPSTSISFSLPTSGMVQLAIYDVSGRRVRTLLNGLTEAGDHTIHFDGRDDRGNHVASGIYFLRLNASGEVRTKRLVLVR